ncbi:MAG: hypothetical protein QOG96_4420 [Pseudonocardiales bacterium]|jgi:hypothetical protein|nr:hypothetical protein [Pseudonocardiales bacterium]
MGRVSGLPAPAPFFGVIKFERYRGFRLQLPGPEDLAQMKLTAQTRVIMTLTRRNSG